jgi:hybrid cluster-associated redox disulfide protein
MKINESTTVEDALKGSEGAVMIFRKYKLDCPGCRGSGADTIKKVAVNNGLDLKAFLEDLNTSPVK